MYKKVSLFLIIIFLVLITFGGTLFVCYNKILNNEKIEDTSIYSNILDGWNNTLGTVPEVLNKYYYVKPIGQMIIATDANNNYIYAFGDEERFYKMGTSIFATDANNNYIYASAGDATYHYLYYATSSNPVYDYMYTYNQNGSQYFTFDDFDGKYTYLSNEKNQPLLSGNEDNNKVEVVNFNKNAKIYYLVILASIGLASIILISALTTFIIGRVKTKKNEQKIVL